jgi:hypothetical protein
MGIRPATGYGVDIPLHPIGSLFLTLRGVPNSQSKVVLCPIATKS